MATKENLQKPWVIDYINWLTPPGKIDPKVVKALRDLALKYKIEVMDDNR